MGYPPCVIEDGCDVVPADQKYLGWPEVSLTPVTP